MGDVVAAGLADVLPVLLELAGLIVALAIARAAEYVRRKWGLEIEARHRDALHSAIMTGLGSALAAGITDRDTAARLAAAHVRASVPDAVRALKPGDDVLRALAAAKLGQDGGF